MKKFVFLFFSYLFTFGYAYSYNLDSLENCLKKSTKTIDKIHNLNNIIEFCEVSKIDYYNNKIKILLDNSKNSLHKDTITKYESTYYNNLGFIYENKGEIKKALNCYILSLKYAEKVNDIQQVAYSYQNLASLYDLQGDYTKALKYYYKSYAIKQKLGNKKGMAYSLNNIAYVHTLMGNYDSTYVTYRKSANLFLKLNDSQNYTLVLNNIGFVFMEQNNLDSAKYYINKTLLIREKNDDQLGLIYSYINLSKIYLKENNLNKSQNLAERAYDLAKKHGTLRDQKNVSSLLHAIYYKNGNPAKAYEVYLNHIKIRDKITNDENKSEVVRQQLKYENDIKISKLEKDKAVQATLSEEKSRRQLLVIIFGVIGFVIVCVFSYFLFKRYRISQNQTLKISSQKEIIEEKQKEINDSISYAERIQKSFLASSDIFQQSLSDYFVFFKPKDVVSGDFYWANKLDNQLYICVADSTGHGIPGAFMSLLNISLLNEGLLSKGIKKPNLLLDFVRKILILGLKPDESGHGGNDGMDCMCIHIDLNTLKLTFAGANNSLWIIRNKELTEIKADKMPVGRSPKQDIPFSLNEFQLEKDDCIYLFSDGYPDQFGGAKGKKFKYKAFEEMLMEHVDKPMKKQKDLISTTFSSWKGELEQTDDVCVMGLKI